MIHLGKAIRHQAALRSVSNRRLAKQLGIAPATLGEYYEKADLSTDIVRRACIYFGIDFFKMLSDDLNSKEDTVYSVQEKNGQYLPPPTIDNTMNHDQLYQAALNIHADMLRHHISIRSERPMTRAAEDAVDSTAELLHYLERKKNT